MRQIPKYEMRLQLMAGNPNTNVLGDSGLSAENKEFYDRTLIETAGPQLIHSQFGQKRPIPKNGGKTITFRRYAELPKALTPLTEGVTPDGRKMSVSEIESTVNQYGDYITLSDMLELAAIDNNVVEATKRIGRQSGLTIDTIVRNIMVAGTSVYYAPKSTGEQPSTRSGLDASCVLTVDVVKRVAAILKACNAPTIGGDYVAIVHPYVAYDIMADDKWEECHKYTSPENMMQGEIGRIAGVRFVETSEAKIWNDSTCPANGSTNKKLSVFATLFLAEGAYGVTEIEGGGLQTIIKQLGSAGSADPLNQRATVGWKATQTAEILVPAYIVRVESTSAFSTTAEAN